MSSDAQQIFFWPSQNNTAREELKKKNSGFSQILYLNFNSLHDLGKIFPKSENWTT